MVVGFNHNVRYQGAIYHIQTEDSGLKNPHVITHLYRGGTIIATRKTGYADIARTESIGQVVEDLMKDQHKEMLRGLKGGAFDDAIAARCGCTERVAAVAGAAQTRPADAPAKASAPRPEPPPTVREDEPAADTRLDDLIVSYLTGDDQKI